MASACNLLAIDTLVPFRLPSGSESLEQFVYRADHGLKVPVRTINVFCILLGEDAGDALPSQAREDLRFVLAAPRLRCRLELTTSLPWHGSPRHQFIRRRLPSIGASTDRSLTSTRT